MFRTTSPSFPPARRVRRGIQAAVLLAGAALLAGCGGAYYDDPYYDDRYYNDRYHSGYPSYCGDNAVPAIVVRFRVATTGEVVPVIASGTVTETGTRTSYQMKEWEVDGAPYGYMWSLAGAPDMWGSFDVDVLTSAGERFYWPSVRVASSTCGPQTVTLDAGVTRR